MARSLIFPMQNLQLQLISASSFFVLIVVFSVFSIVTFLCASHRTKKSHREKEETTSPQLNEKRLLTKLNSNISSKAHMMVKMISWKKVQGEEKDEKLDDSDEAVWRRKIIMGERCRPFDFSGKIVYDSDGNLFPGSESVHQNRKKTIV